MTLEVGSRLSVEAAIRKFIAEELLFIDGELPVGDEGSFLENDIIDSTGVLELELFVENGFGVEVLDEEVIPENFDSVARLAAYIRRKQGLKCRSD